MPPRTIPSSLRALGQLSALLLPQPVRRGLRVAEPDPQDPHIASWSAWLLTALATGIGIWLSLRSAELRSGLAGAFASVTSLAHLKRPAPITWEAISFVVVTLVWGAVLKSRLTADTIEQRERRAEIKRWITHAMLDDVVVSYPAQRFQPVRRILADPVPSGLPPEESAKHVANTIRTALEQITQLAQDFARVSDGSYGASIMLVATPEQFTPALRERLIFHDPAHAGALRAMLYLVPELLVTHTQPAKRVRDVPSIALPVPSGVDDATAGTDAEGSRILLPGAPTALLSGNPSVQEDAREMVEACADFAAPVKRRIRDYFSDHGAGRHVRSFASFRLSANPDEPVGVLNIDSDRPYVLGREPEYYATIYALLAPLLELLCTKVREYALLRGEDVFAVAPRDAGGPRPSSG